jgi:exportin-1
MAQAAQNMDVLSNIDNIKILANVLKTNVSASTSIGTFFSPQLGRIFMDMLGLYKAVSGIISETVAREGMYSRIISMVHTRLMMHQVKLLRRLQKFAS